MRFRRIHATLMAVGLSVGMSTLAAVPASAQCGDAGKINYSTKGKTVRIGFKGIPSFKNGPGPLHMVVQKQQTGEASWSVSVGTEADLKAIFASAKVQVSTSLTLTNSTAVTNGIDFDVPKDKYGNAKYVSWGKKVSWKKYKIMSDCSTKLLDSGVINFPTKSEGWYKWISSS